MVINPVYIPIIRIPIFKVAGMTIPSVDSFRRWHLWKDGQFQARKLGRSLVMANLQPTEPTFNQPSQLVGSHVGHRMLSVVDTLEAFPK